MNKKKAAKKKPGPKPKQKHLNGTTVEPFEVVTNPPVLSGWATPEIQLIRDKVDATIKLIQPGQGFIIDYKHKGVVTAHLKRTFPTERFGLQHIPGNSKMARVVWAAQKKPGK